MGSTVFDFCTLLIDDCYKTKANLKFEIRQLEAYCQSILLAFDVFGMLKPYSPTVMYSLYTPVVRSFSPIQNVNYCGYNLLLGDDTTILNALGCLKQSYSTLVLYYEQMVQDGFPTLAPLPSRDLGLNCCFMQLVKLIEHELGQLQIATFLSEKYYCTTTLCDLYRNALGLLATQLSAFERMPAHHLPRALKRFLAQDSFSV